MCLPKGCFPMAFPCPKISWSHGVAVDALDNKEENLFADLHEIWIKYCLDMYAANPQQRDRALILHSEKTFKDWRCYC